MGPRALPGHPSREVEALIEQKRAGKEIVIQAEPGGAGQGGGPDGGAEREHRPLGPGAGKSAKRPDSGRQATAAAKRAPAKKAPKSAKQPARAKPAARRKAS